MFVVRRISDGKYWARSVRHYHYGGPTPESWWVSDIYNARFFRTRGAAMQSCYTQVRNTSNQSNLWQHPILRKRLFNEQFIRPELKMDLSLREDRVIWHPIPHPQAT